MVPQLVICNKCGSVLYESIEELRSPDEIIQSYDGKCPTCGRRLSYIPKHFEVKPIDETEQRGLLETEQKKPSRKKSRSEARKRGRKRSAQATNRNREAYERRTKKRKKDKGSVWNGLLPLLWKEIDFNTKK